MFQQRIFPHLIYSPRECKVADIWWHGEETVLVESAAERSQSVMVAGGGSSNGGAEL